MNKNNKGLVEYCKKQLGLPYWWRNVWAGCFAKTL